MEDVLKGAFLLEQRGKTFYKKTANDVTIFPSEKPLALLVDEEGRRMKILGDLFYQYWAKGEVRTPDVGKPGRILDTVLTERSKREMSVAVYSAMGFEEKAMAFYAERADTVVDPNVRTSSAGPPIGNASTSSSSWSSTRASPIASDTTNTLNPSEDRGFSCIFDASRLPHVHIALYGMSAGS